MHPTHRAGAQNLLHYLAMRRQDIRELQTKLAMMGLSSLGRAESHALSSVEAVLRVIHQLNGADPKLRTEEAHSEQFSGAALLDEHAAALLGPEPQKRTVRVLVTMPSEAATADGSSLRAINEALVTGRHPDAASLAAPALAQS